MCSGQPVVKIRSTLDARSGSNVCGRLSIGRTMKHMTKGFDLFRRVQQFVAAQRVYPLGGRGTGWIEADMCGSMLGTS